MSRDIGAYNNVIDHDTLFYDKDLAAYCTCIPVLYLNLGVYHFNFSSVATLHFVCQLIV